MLMKLYRALASVRLTVILLLVLAATLLAGIVWEAKAGREFAQWYVYGSPGLVGLLGLLGLNMLAAFVFRFPWPKSQLGWAAARLGVLVLLTGAFLTWRAGREGTLTLRPGEQADRIQLTTSSAITVARPEEPGRPAATYAFRPGPADWPDGRQLDFGTADGVGLKILKFYQHARGTTEWVADEHDFVGPALQLLLTGPSGNTVTKDWLSGNLFGGEAVIGPTHYELLPLPAETMLDDFLNPPTEQPGRSGILSMHYQGQMLRVPVADRLGQKIPLGDSGLAVEIVEYLANARPTPSGRFASRDDRPKNPLLELKVYEPGQEQPLRQLAFAKRPLLTLDGVHGRECPVKFWYHHSGLTAIPGAVFVQTPQGRLYCRPVVDGRFEPARAVQVGERVALGGQFAITVLQHLPRARQDVRFLPVESATERAAEAEAAALIELTYEGQSRQVWLQRNDPQYGFQRIFTEHGWIELTCDYDTVPLGYTLELRELKRDSQAESAEPTLLATVLRVQDPSAGLDQVRQVASNEPLVHGKFTIRPSGFQSLPLHPEVVTFTAVYDPGRWFKYTGGLLIGAGGLVGLVTQIFRLRRKSRVVALPATSTATEPRRLAA
jgi:hypothetical protein